MIIFSNIGGAVTPVGDPPNVIVASNAYVVQSVSIKNHMMKLIEIDKHHLNYCIPTIFAGGELSDVQYSYVHWNPIGYGSNVFPAAL